LCVKEKTLDANASRIYTWLMVISFKIPGKPIPKGRPRFARGKVHTPTRTRDYEKLVKALALKARGTTKPFTGPVGVVVLIGQDETHVEIRPVGVAAVPKAKIRGDIDNIAKSLMDGLNRVIYKDDRQVVSLTVALQ
jgi:Holliday junction resolvase RusA-like endonuclease